MVGPPQDECPVRTVPQTAQEEDDRQVDVGSHGTFAVAAQREIEIVPEPA